LVGQRKFKVTEDKKLYELWLGQWLFPAVIASDEVGLLSAIIRGQSSVDSLASGLRIHPQGVAIVCDILTNLGFLEKVSADSYSVTSIGRA
jgi:hypothetical protein